MDWSPKKDDFFSGTSMAPSNLYIRQAKFDTQIPEFDTQIPKFNTQNFKIRHPNSRIRHLNSTGVEISSVFEKKDLRSHYS